MPYALCPMPARAPHVTEKGYTFEAFIIRKLVPQLWKGACVVMDNCTIHTGEEIEKAI